MTPDDRELGNLREAWGCKIGSRKGVSVPSGGDAPMRRAVEDAFFKLTGERAEAIFSGWGEKFSENERAVIENRLPVLQTDQIATLTAQAEALQKENEALKAALHKTQIGVNHIATYRTDRWPEAGTDHEQAFRTLGATQEYDMWCCWNAVMTARAAIAAAFEWRPIEEANTSREIIALATDGSVYRMDTHLNHRGETCWQTWANCGFVEGYISHFVYMPSLPPVPEVKS